MSLARTSWVGAAVALGLTACAVGPNYTRPTPPSDPAMAQPQPSTRRRRPRDAPATPSDSSPAWTFPASGGRCSSPAARSAHPAGSRGNPDVGGAQAALKQAHELYLAQKTSFLPNVQGSFGGARSEYPAGTLTAPRTRRTRPIASIRRSSPDLHARRVRPPRGERWRWPRRRNKAAASSSRPPISP